MLLQLKCIIEIPSSKIISSVKTSSVKYLQLPTFCANKLLSGSKSNNDNNNNGYF